MSNQYFHFTIGPVQGFVAQARRTRDLWAGSFLLSYLSAVALKETEAQGGTILFPTPDQNFILALEGKSSKPPQQGSIPNRFKAEVPKGFKTEDVISAVKLAWQEIAKSVLNKDLSNRSSWTDKHKKNWDNQINNFWELTWAINHNDGDSSILDKRKNWRSHIQPTQYGDKCMMMEGYQELSAEPRPNTKKQKLFWSEIQKDLKLDLRVNEKLCAMAFVKRRFTKTFNDLSVSMPGGWTLKGWKLTENVPSVQYLSAVHWIKSLIYQLDNPDILKAADEFNKVAGKYAGRGEFQTSIKCIHEAQIQTGQHPLTSLDGAVFYESLLESGNSFEKEPSIEILKALKKLKKLAKNLEELPPYYAILLMDGDSLGEQMSDESKQPVISKALDQFTREVPNIIHQNNGFLIYAGGDDVLAILPLQDAIPAAIACRNAYNACFEGSIVKSSLSGAIEYVHIKSPLMSAISKSHHLLDEIAKDQTGRDSLAIRINKPGNENAVWSMPWKYALGADNELGLAKLASSFTMKDTNEQGLSSKFIYSLRDKYSQFDLSDFEPEQRINLILTDYLSSGSAITNASKARALIKDLLSQMKHFTRNSIREDFYESASGLDINAGLIARFLAQKGRD